MGRTVLADIGDNIILLPCPLIPPACHWSCASPDPADTGFGHWIDISEFPVGSM